MGQLLPGFGEARRGGIYRRVQGGRNKYATRRMSKGKSENEGKECEVGLAGDRPMRRH